MQGSGKTTLGNILAWIFSKLDISFDSQSIDDYYLPFHERQKLDKQQYWFRGPPGTHSVDEILNFFQQWKSPDDQSLYLEVPVFDKSLHSGQGDRTMVRRIDKSTRVILFEGWFVGFKEQEMLNFNQLELPDGQILSDYDLSYAMNKKLSEYEKIWD